MDNDGRRRTAAHSCGSCPLQDARLAAGLSVKVRSENGGHGCRRLTGWDGREASLIAIGTRAENEVRSSN
jgi:hypothetical protein